MDKSPFLQYLFNRLQATRKTLYNDYERQREGISSVMQEQLRTIRLLFTDSEKNVEMRKVVTESIFCSFMDLQNMTPADIDTIMGFIPEASFRMISIGTPCVDRAGKAFCSLGVLSTGADGKNSHQQSILSKMNTKSSPNMSALFYDPTNPGRQDVIQVKINESLPLLDLDNTKTQTAARKSIFMDASSLESLMDIVLAESDPDEPPQ